MDFLFQNKSSLLFGLGVVIMIAILMRRWSRYFKRQRSAKRKSGRAAGQASKSQQPLMDAPPEILRWQVEMHETARDLKAELDTKIAVLQRLTIDARRHAQRLDEVLQRAERLEASAAREDV